MALNTHHFFSDALRNDEAITQKIDGNIYLDVYDEDLMGNLPVPYIIVMHEGTTNSEADKDDTFEGDIDIDNVSLEIAAESDEDLVELAQMARNCIRSAAEEFNEVSQETYGFDLVDYDFRTNGISYDSGKPCYYTILQYQVTTQIY